MFKKGGLLGKGGLIDKATRNADKKFSEGVLGLEKGHNLGQILKPDSDNHNAAMRDLKGLEPSKSSEASRQDDELLAYLNEDDSEVANTTHTETSSSNVSSSSSSITPESASSTPMQSDNNAVSSNQSTATTEEPSVTKIKTMDDLQNAYDKFSINNNNNQPTIDKSSQILVWAKTLLEHKELTDVDKILLPNFLKTKEEVNKLIGTIAVKASENYDGSYVTVCSDLTTEIIGLYPDIDFS